MFEYDSRKLIFNYRSDELGCGWHFVDEVESKQEERLNVERASW
jgi:hypothetical protein